MILEVYGRPECGAVSALNTPETFRLGTAGRPLPGVEVRVAEDGEILLGGRGLMRGYYNRPEETKARFTKDGFLRTGDFGTLDDDGYLRVRRS